MTPSIDDRFQQLETTSRTHHEMLNLLISLGEAQQTLLENQQAILERQQQLLEEIRRDASQTQRLWVRLAQKYGWLEDDDLFQQ